VVIGACCRRIKTITVWYAEETSARAGGKEIKNLFGMASHSIKQVWQRSIVAKERNMS
jgi:hypothetical protein